MDVRYTRDHEYIAVADGIGKVGITDYAQAQLGAIVFVELPAVGAVLGRGQEAALVESVKAASDIFSPASGKVVTVNAELSSTPGRVNEDPTGQGWFFAIELADPDELDALMRDRDYEAYVATLG